jgi:DNA-binding transcriptional MerR regulator
MDAMLAIGPFSTATQLSVKALRNYHEMGLLVPATVDPRTGYRAYSVDQIADATVIRRLRQLDVPLGEIRQVIEARDPNITAKLLAAHEATMRERLAEAERIVAQLQSVLAEPGAHTPIHVRNEPPQHMLALHGRSTESGYPAFFDHAYAVLDESVANAEGDVCGPPGALYPPEITDDENDVVAFLPIAHPVDPGHRNVVLGELPAVTTAVLTHVGPFTEMDLSYRTLGAWVARHAVPSGEWVRERYLTDPTSTPDPADHRTEICWPIVAPSTTPMEVPT